VAGWLEGKNYKKGERVTYKDDVYQANGDLFDVHLKPDPIYSPYWFFVRKINRLIEHTCCGEGQKAYKCRRCGTKLQ
jgi:hypothetical protein